MGDEIDAKLAALIKTTQSSLGAVIKKPPLTEKLLARPPFRFIHDIITSVIRGTGFMKGLYSADEMNPDNVKDKEAKIAFLQKAIDIAALVTGESLGAKPGKIVAGQESDRTNEFLQALAAAAKKNVNNEEYVNRVLKGANGKTDKTEKAATNDKEKERKAAAPAEKDRDRDREKDKDKDREKPSRDDKSRRKDDEKPDDKSKAKERDAERGDKAKDREKPRDADRDRLHGDREKPRDADRDRLHGDREKPRDADRDRLHGDREKPRDADRDRDRDRDDKKKDREKEPDREKERDRRGERDRGGDPDRDRDRDRAKDGRERRTDDDKEKGGRPREEDEKRRDKTAAESAAVSKDESRERKPAEREPIKPKQNLPQAPSQDNGATEEPDLPPQVANARRMERVASARQGPPKPATKPPGADRKPAGASSSETTKQGIVIERDQDDEQRRNDDEDAQFTVNTTSADAFAFVDEPKPTIKADNDQQHGALVKTMLDKKEQLKGGSQLPGSRSVEVVSAISEADRRKQRQNAQQEVDALRGSIQQLTRFAVPLGKLLDYVPEDLDTMQKELQQWRSETNQLAQQLKREQQATDASLAPLRAQLEELDLLCADQVEQNLRLKGRIVQNDEKLERIIQSMASGSGKSGGAR